MRATVDLPEGLLHEARQAAHEDNTTLSALIAAGLRTVLDRRLESQPYVLEDRSVRGSGLQPEFQGASWEKLRDAIYGDTPTPLGRAHTVGADAEQRRQALVDQSPQVQVIAEEGCWAAVIPGMPDRGRGHHPRRGGR